MDKHIFNQLNKFLQINLTLAIIFMSQIIFHKAGPNDIQILVEARIDFLSEYWGVQDQNIVDKLRAELRLFFEPEIQAKTYVCWFARDENKLVAIGGMKIIQKPGSFRIPDGRCGYIMNMYTAPEFRRRGLAKTILEKLMEEGKAMGIHFFELHATEDGEPLYIQNGFELHKEPTYRKFV